MIVTPATLITLRQSRSLQQKMLLVAAERIGDKKRETHELLLVLRLFFSKNRLKIADFGTEERHSGSVIVYNDCLHFNVLVYKIADRP